jgi:hypothetical protein
MIVKIITMLLFLSGCSQQMFRQDPKGIAAVSYQTHDGWRLRRLAIAPIQYEFSKGGERQTETENATRRELLSVTRKILSEEKEYELIPLQIQIYEDIIVQKFSLSEEQFKEHLDFLTAWATTSGDGEQPPERVATAASKLGHPLNVDGLLILRGSMSLPDPIKCVGNSLLVTGPFFPLGRLYFCQMETHIRADIYEVSTGRIVWRRELRDNRALSRGGVAQIFRNVGASQLLQPLERAAVKNSTEEQR